MERKKLGDFKHVDFKNFYVYLFVCTMYGSRGQPVEFSPTNISFIYYIYNIHSLILLGFNLYLYFIIYYFEII